MPDRMIERLDVGGFTSIVEASVELRPLNVLVGANGAGKSNLIRALELLGGSSTRTCASTWRAAVARPPSSTPR